MEIILIWCSVGLVNATEGKKDTSILQLIKAVKQASLLDLVTHRLKRRYGTQTH
jgi:hypothetical protein